MRNDCAAQRCTAKEWAVGRHSLHRVISLHHQVSGRHAKAPLLIVNCTRASATASRPDSWQPCQTAVGKLWISLVDRGPPYLESPLFVRRVFGTNFRGSTTRENGSETWSGLTPWVAWGPQEDTQSPPDVSHRAQGPWTGTRGRGGHRGGVKTARNTRDNTPSLGVPEGHSLECFFERIEHVL